MRRSSSGSARASRRRLSAPCAAISATRWRRSRRSSRDRPEARVTDPIDIVRAVGGELNTAVIGDILDEMGFRRQFLPPEIRALDPDATMVGLAMPVVEQDTSGPDEPFGKMFEALDSLRPGEIYLA